MKQNLKPHFRAALKPEGVLELSVYEEIGENFWTGGGVTALNVKEQLESAKSYDRIAVRINSPGGDAFEGVAIRSVLRSTKKPIDVYIDGIAASAASILAMAGDTITMAPGSMMMIHDAWSMCVGNDEDMRKMEAPVLVETPIVPTAAAPVPEPVVEIKPVVEEPTNLSQYEARLKFLRAA
jgi:ATP-dependent protease ClpP protease subunit